MKYNKETGKENILTKRQILKESNYRNAVVFVIGN